MVLKLLVDGRDKAARKTRCLIAVVDPDVTDVRPRATDAVVEG